MFHIVGNGIGGAYLARLLLLKKQGVIVYGVKHREQCGLRGCGWGFGPEAISLIQKAQLNPDKYILSRNKEAIVEGVRVPCNLVSMDKPALIKDLLSDIRVFYGKAVRNTPVFRSHPALPDLVPGMTLVDARGLVDSNMKAACVQLRVWVNEPQIPSFHSIPGVGYRWVIPLGDKEAHFGMGRLGARFENLWRDLNKIVAQYKPICGCSGFINLSGPDQKLPNGWRLGEAAGLVNSLTGEGNVPAMKSALQLVDNISNFGSYNSSLIKEFSWMSKGAKVVRRVSEGDWVDLLDYFILLRCFRESGFYPKLSSLPKLYLRIRKGLRR